MIYVIKIITQPITSNSINLYYSILITIMLICLMINVNLTKYDNNSFDKYMSLISITLCILSIILFTVRIIWKV